MAADLTVATTAFPDAAPKAHDEWVTGRAAQINTLLNLLYVLLGLSLVVSLFGMLTTLALSVFERTRELGMLRAVRLSRRQVRRAVRHESIIVALIGAAVGLPLGVGLAALVTFALRDFDVPLSLPVGGIITITLVAVVCGILAAVGPARRASRLNVVEALRQA